MLSFRTVALWLWIGLMATARGEEATDWKAIDAHARAAPKEAAETVEKLAGYLGKSARSDAEKARAIFVWITENICYDLDGVAKGRFEQRPAVVVRKQCTDCGGQALLFQ